MDNLRKQVDMANRTCTVEGCDKRLEAIGLCGMHRSRMRNHGTTDLPPRPTFDSIEERFFSKVDKTATCWLWRGPIAGNGYGHFWCHGARSGAHRFSWASVNGPIPDLMVVDHICRVRHCVNPDHLRLATKSQNRQNHGGGTDYPTASGVRGVWPHGARWQAVVYVNQVVAYRESFDTLEEASDAVKAARITLHTHNDIDRVA